MRIYLAKYQCVPEYGMFLLFCFFLYKQTTSGEVGKIPIDASSRNYGGIWVLNPYTYTQYPNHSLW